MISLKFDGICEGCKNAELILDALDISSFEDGMLSSKLWTVRCIHEDVCSKWNTQLDSLYSQEKQVP